jgi:hypothetical protein
MSRGRQRKRGLVSPPKMIWLRTCTCPDCLGKGAACMDGFNWLGRPKSDHAQQHAQADLLEYFDRLPAEIQDALNGAAVNVCSWCAEIWLKKYGAPAAVELVRNARFVGEAEAATFVRAEWRWAMEIGQ